MPQSPNALELSLARAAADPASRPEFYKTLLESEVYVIGFSDSAKEGRSTLPEGSKLSIVNWQKKDGTPIVPFFTSLEALQSALKEEARFVTLPARSFLEMTRGSSLVLNPTSSYGKEFYPNEVQALLETGMNQVPARRVVQKATTVLFGQPANYPTQMVSALASLLARHANVKAAYLCLMHDPESGEKPGLIVGFEGDGDLTDAMKEAGSVAADTAPGGEPVDFTVLKRNEAGISAYMYASVKPFYQRSWGAKLRAFVGRPRT